MIKFDEQGLVPAVIQDAATGQVLMMAWMNSEALEATRRTGRTHYWSRTRQKLWMKGEESGHFQEVEGVYINCEENSLLIKVQQVGPAACHDGYRSCYYRQVNPDGSATVIAEKLFDPDQVYGTARAAIGESSGQDDLERLMKIVYGAYEYLKENDLTGVSATSRELHLPDFRYLRRRVIEELAELRGVVDGTHRHSETHDDLILEAHEICYWMFMICVASGISYEDVRPDLPLASGYHRRNVRTSKLTREMTTIEDNLILGDNLGRKVACAQIMQVIGQACSLLSVNPIDVVDRDLKEMRQRAYLAPYFAKAL